MSSRINRKLVVLGAGESGTGAARLGQAKGWEVLVSDRGAISEKYRAELDAHGIAYEANGHTEARVLAADLVVKSPGIPDQAPLVRALHARQIPVISELEWGFRHTKARFVAITGSNGKTTTTLLTHHLLRAAGLNVGLAGNVGTSLARQVIEDAHDWYVLEVSSFQLDGMYDFRAHVAVLLNITPDHLDRYDYQFEKYVDAKFRIARNQTASDFFISYDEDPVVRNELLRRRLAAQPLKVSLTPQPDEQLGAAASDTHLHVYWPPHTFGVMLDELPLKGPHNMINTGVALLVTALLGADIARVRAALPTFRNAPHRLETVGQVTGVTYINDSKATNVDAVLYALQSAPGPVVWLAGGTDKGNDYTQLLPLVREKVKALVAIGRDNAPLQATFGDLPLTWTEADTMDAAVAAAARLAKPGDTVLLSPACASFDRFRNYEDRGDQFRAAVVALDDV